MPESQRNTIIIPNVGKLDELVQGDYALRGPVNMDDVSQQVIILGMTVTRETPMGNLDVGVNVGPDQKVVTISRAADQGLLQVKSLEEGVPPAETPFVFAHPIGGIVVGQTVGQPWQVLKSDAEVTDHAGLSHFLRIVGQFGKLALTPGVVVG